MELWIRSQDKERLIKVSELMIRDDYILYSIATISNDKTMGYPLINLGTYKTKERALEVLDKLQEVLMMCIKANGTEYLEGTSCYVYEMPQE